MLSLSPRTRVFLAVEPVDMRGSFHALAGKVRTLGLDPLDGQLYLFLARNRRLLKLLYFDSSGWCIWQKRLERGTFQLPAIPDQATQLLLDRTAFLALLEGIDLHAPRRRWYRRPTPPG